MLAAIVAVLFYGIFVSRGLWQFVLITLKSWSSLRSVRGFSEKCVRIWLWIDADCLHWATLFLFTELYCLF